MDRKEIESILKDYRWMMNSIKLLRSSMEDAGERLVKEYGEESDMPKAKGGSGDPVFQEVKRREKRWNVISKYEKKVKIIQDRIHLIKDQREAEILHWLLEGKSIKWIASHMGLSERHIFRLRDNIIETMSVMSETADKMTLEKIYV